MGWFKHLRDKIAGAVKSVANTIKKDINKIKEVAQKDINKARNLIKSLAKKIGNAVSNVALLPIVPLLPAIKHMLRAHGQSAGGSLREIVERFYNYVVRRSAHFEDLEAFNFEDFDYLIEQHLEAGLKNNFAYFELGSNGVYEHLDEQGGGVDVANVGAQAAAGVAGAAVGIPPPVSTTIGSGIEKLIKVIVSYFKKNKDNATVQDALAKTGSTGAIDDATTAQDAVNEDGQATGRGNATGRNLGKQLGDTTNSDTIDEHFTPEKILGTGMDFKKIALYLGAFILLIFVAKKMKWI